MTELNPKTRDRLSSYLSIHNKPVQYLIVGILELLKYQKVLMDPILWEPYIDSLKDMIIKDFDDLKKDAGVNK